MADCVDNTQPQFPGTAVEEDSFYYVDHDMDVPPNGILKSWRNTDKIVNTTYDDLESEAKQLAEGWWAAKNEPYREALKDLPCAMFVACKLSQKLVKEAFGSELTDERGCNPVYVTGSMSSHLLHMHNIYETFASVAEPYATAMEMTWNTLKLYKADKSMGKTIADEMNYRLYIYSCSLVEGRLGHRLGLRRHGLFIKEWIKRQQQDTADYDRFVHEQVDFVQQQVASLCERHDNNDCSGTSSNGQGGKKRRDDNDGDCSGTSSNGQGGKKRRDDNDGDCSGDTSSNGQGGKKRRDENDGECSGTSSSGKGGTKRRDGNNKGGSRKRGGVIQID